MANKEDEFWEAAYGYGAAIVGFITFIGCWIYCIYSYGFLLGVGLGWLPALITAFVVGALWLPLLALAIVFVLIVFK